MWQANRALPATGRLERRAATRTAREATEAHGTAEDAMRRRWGDVPLTATHLPFWAEDIAGQRVDADPRVVEARQDAAHAARRLQDLTAHHADARAALCRLAGDGQWPSTIRARAAELRSGVDQARGILAELEALPVTAAAQLIQDRAAEAAAERSAEAASQTRAAEHSLRHSPSPVYQPGPERGFGPSL